MEEHEMMLSQRRNTDCVYFLASPLTCIKGMECEYRHNEIARLNPRDCWYWLAGNCLNPACAFRHPPLEIHAEEPPESSLSSLPANKTNVPCYFFFHSFCNKGDRCSFMHGPDANISTGNSGNSASGIKEEISLDNKRTIGNNIVSAPTEAHANLSEAAAKAFTDLKVQPKVDFQFCAPEKIAVGSPSPRIANSQCEEAVTLKPDFMLHADSFTESSSHGYSDESSEEDVNDHVEPEESSPGFDVLVDGESENLHYEDHQNILLPYDREHNLHNNLSGYDFENVVEYDLPHYDAEDKYEDGDHHYLDFVNDVHIFDDVGNGASPSRNPMSDSFFPQKRKYVERNVSINGRRIDLRDHLGKRRAIDDHHVIQSFRRHSPSHLLGGSQGRLWRPANNQQPHIRLVSEVINNAFKPHQKNKSLLNDANQLGGRRHSRSSSSRQRDKERKLAKRQFLSSEVVRKPVPREMKSSRESNEFTGPKTLAQIKEEKKAAEENGDCPSKFLNATRKSVPDFESPKPLSEILIVKRRPSFT
ncbi:zinc finger CCCH domain-containing protein 34-like [Mercurialis annua]|uniref:zinc finger CCCH domain-containing protein 34-like n=1 Tax=Mercurialis annua TaxID=3986 RepID=UPI00215F329D|nr:zinc finger CCCH domain-containing protein 34-like [Mercurialis annua]